MAATKADPEGEKPIKVLEQRVSEAVLPPRSARRSARRAVANLDEELYYHLLRFSTFRDRTVSLMQTLLAKAYKFLDDHDTTAITYKDRWTAAIAATTRAMDVTPQEVCARNHFKNTEQADQRAKNHKLITTGFVGHSGPFRSVCTPLPT